MKLIGKQIVVELPEKKYCGFHKDNSEWFVAQAGKSCEYCFACKQRNASIAEAARMNQAMEVDVEKIMETIFDACKGINKTSTNQTYTLWLQETECRKIAHALATNPSAWLKRKDVVE